MIDWNRIAELKKSGGDAEEMVTEMRGVSARIKELEKSLSEIGDELDRVMYRLPNLPHESVPAGADENDNPLVKLCSTMSRRNVASGHVDNKNYVNNRVWRLGENSMAAPFVTCNCPFPAPKTICRNHWQNWPKRTKTPSPCPAT